MRQVPLSDDVRLEVEEAGKIRLSFERLKQAMQGQLLKDLGTELMSQTEERLEHGKRSPDGTPWAPWSKSYKAWRAKAGKDDGKYGELSGDMLKSISYRVLGADRVQWGANEEHASWFQDGYLVRKTSSKGKAYVKRQPARPFVGLSRLDEEALMRLTQKFMEKHTDEA